MEVVDYFSKEKPNLVMMIGLSGSGKSTASKTIYIDDVSKKTVILSSDALRAELFNDVNDQTHNEQVFNTLKQRAYKYCSEGKNVVIDATNLNVKDRAWIFNSWKKDVPVNRIACIIPTSLKECKVRNQARIRKVPEYVIDRQIRKFEIPFYEEGWDKICIWGVDNENTNIKKPYAFNALMYRMSKFNQNNPHHIFNLYLHSKAISFFYKPDDYMKEVAFLHDCKKPYVEIKNEDGISHYYQHANVSAYYVLTHPWLIKDFKNFLDILFYINYHMIGHSIQSDKSYQKYLKIFGKEKMEKLLKFVEYDKIASDKLIFNDKNNNTYERKENYYIGRNRLGQFFYIDLEDLPKVINYGWCYKDPKNNDFRLVTCDENNAILFMHRIIMNENTSNILIDHIGHEQFDNRKKFLRKCNQWDNSKNTTLSKNNSSGFNGVSYISKIKKYRAYINNKYKQIYIGLFNTAEEANKARIKYEKELYKDFSPTMSKIIVNNINDIERKLNEHPKP